MKLTPDQEKALKLSTEDWDVLIITGKAGTGKTTLLKEIQDKYKKKKWNVFPGSFTGRAAAVLRQKGLNEARTIHYHIWGRPTMYVEFKKAWKLIRLKFTRKLSDNELWIIDEASMLHEGLLTHLLDHIHNPEREKKLGLFGRKLNELWDDPSYKIEASKKIIFCGDPNQLPPIYGNSMPAFDKKALEKFKFKVDSFQLTTLIRHQESTEIQTVASILDENSNQPGIEKIESKKFNPEKIAILDAESIEDIAGTYLEYYKKNPLQIKYINYLNQLVHEFNIYIRTKIFNTNPRELLVKGDLIHVTQNNYFYDLWNGDHLIIKDVDKTFEGPDLEITCYEEHEEGEKVKGLKGNFKILRKKLNLSFTRVTVEHTETNKRHTLFAINETLNNQEGDNWIYRQRENVIHEVTEYLQKFFFYRHPEIPDLDYKELKELRETDEYNNALFINYAYAITGHKAQGGEWDYTLVDLTTSVRIPKGWVYTSITRASKKAFIIPNRSR
tara:strand:+ start:1948 stop:3444 length:1497 start_codon:yes stop_codon:yes gene_type:complete